MPKEASKQFRKGTKSCVECRQRKLRCIPSSDDTQPCQNCAAKGRRCVLQVHAGRDGQASTRSSRDRIRQLEDSVGKLWSIVKDLRTELGHSNGDPAPDLDPNPDSRMDEDEDGGDSESDNSEVSLLQRPTHLQQLFDNEILDMQDEATPSSLGGGGKAAMHAITIRARSRLQVLIPPRADFLALAPLAATWMDLYNVLFPRFSVFKDLADVKARYDELVGADADPVTIAALLLWMGTAVQHSSEDSLAGLSELVRDGPRFVRRVAGAVQENVVIDDTLAASLEGIEISMLWIRFKLSGTNPKTPWLALRRCIAIAEAMRLPRSRDPHASAVWESICIVDRLVGMLYNMPLGTTAYGLPRRYEITSGQNVEIKAFLYSLARICAAVQDIDNAYLWQRSDQELFGKVYETDQDLRALYSMTPTIWWKQGPELGIPAILMQFWYHYLTVRAHLQLALRNSTAPECINSFKTCLQACQDLTDRYVTLRAAVPPSFFAGRVIDLEAMTAAVFLIYTSRRSDMGQAYSSQGQRNGSSRQMAFRIVQVWDTVYSQAGGTQIGFDVARKAAKAVRQLDKLLNESGSSDPQVLSVRIPMLGRMNVSRPSKPAQQLSSMPLSGQAGYELADQPQMQANGQGQAAFDPSNMDAMDPWTMDLFIDESLPLMGGDFWGEDPLFSFIDG